MKSNNGTSRFKRSLAALAVSTILGMSGAASAAGSTGTVIGAISGVPASGYTVTIKNPSIGFSREIQVDASGSFRFPQLAIGDYEIVVEDSNGCLFLENVQIDFIISIVESASELPVVYPNPALDNISILHLTKSEKIDILDVTGKSVLNRTISPSESISIADLSAGLYLIRFADNSLKPLIFTKH